MEEKRGIRLKELLAATGAPDYTVKYLRINRRLPLLKESSGSGYPVLYSPECIDIVRVHMAKRAGRRV